jgi:hypothetical protein
MSTYTTHPLKRHHRTTAWTLTHPVTATVAVLVAAVVAGVLIGGLLSEVLDGTPAAQQHRAGGHATAAVAAARHATAAATDEGVVVSTRSFARSPARGGFAVGRAEGAGKGSILIGADARGTAHGGFPGRSLGAGQAPGVG